MISVINKPCGCNRGGDFAIEHYPGGGYLLRPRGERIDPLLGPLEELGATWDPCAWGFWLPAEKLYALRKFIFLNGLRIERRAA